MILSVGRQGFRQGDLSIRQNKRLTISVMLTTGEHVTLDVSPKDKPSDVKRYIGIEKGINVSNQKLMHHEIELTDDKTLAEAKIMNNAIFYLEHEPEIGNTLININFDLLK